MIDLETLMLAAKMGGGGGGGSDPEAVKFTPQTLTEEQQSQARQNIGAAESGSGGTVILTAIPNQSFTAADIYLNDERVTTQSLLNMIAAGKMIVSDVDAGGFKIRSQVWQYTTEYLVMSSFANSPVDGKISIVRSFIQDSGGYATAALEFIPIEN